MPIPRNQTEYRRYYYHSHQEICSICHKKRHVSIRINGAAVCPNCYARDFAPKLSCSHCGRIAKVAAYIEEQPICLRCYCNLSYNSKERYCQICGKKKKGVHRRKGSGLRACPACNQREKAQVLAQQRVCDICGHNSETVHQRRFDKKQVCESCRQTCVSCGKRGPTRRGQCSGCYQSERNETEKVSSTI